MRLRAAPCFVLATLAILVAGPSALAQSPGSTAVAERLQARVVPLQGQANFRDLGGYLTGDGHRVKWGMIYRSGELSRLTAADYQRLSALHIRAICDLRNADERISRPTAWGAAPVRTFVSDKQGVEPAARALQAAGQDGPGAVHRAMIDFYAQMPQLYAPEYKVIFQQLLAGDTPLLLHCTAGKDRSGVAAALILLALGVPRASVIQDYVLTDALLKPDRIPAIKGFSPEATTVLLRADPAYLDAALDTIELRYGSVGGYLDRALGITPSQQAVLRYALLEPSSAAAGR